ncbi:MAG: ABC transporter permease [Candidatus Izemoplasmataceae bacterium]
MISIASAVKSVGYIEILFAYIFVLILLILLRKRGLKKEKVVLIASLRMTVQLVLVGFLLAYIFEHPHPLVTLIILIIMISFAVYTLINKFKEKLSFSLKKVITYALFIGTTPVILYFLWVVIEITPFYNPQYFVPISGMIIGNSMTGISLGISTLVNRFEHNQEEIIEALVLGASPKEASHFIINEAYDQALMPTINSMLGMGIIFLPGMMTGQILSGTNPNLAILYQIGIMMGILGGVSLTTYIGLIFGAKTYFNKEAQMNNMV